MLLYFGETTMVGRQLPLPGQVQFTVSMNRYVFLMAIAVGRASASGAETTEATPRAVAAKRPAAEILIKVDFSISVREKSETSEGQHLFSQNQTYPPLLIIRSIETGRVFSHSSPGRNISELRSDSSNISFARSCN